MSQPWDSLPEVQVQWMGRWRYQRALDAQLQRRGQVIGGHATEALWMQEHEPVLTVGRRAVLGLPPAPFWRDRGIDVVSTGRGGLATFHGPGQLVGSLILDLRLRGLGARRTVRGIEAGLMHWLGTQGIAGQRRAGFPGVWVGERKIASIGLHIQRDVTAHGFALNICNDLTPFEWFDACGIADAGVTSIKSEVGSDATCQEVAFEVGNSVLWSLFESSVDSDRGGR